MRANLKGMVVKSQTPTYMSLTQSLLLSTETPNAKYNYDVCTQPM